MNDWSDIGEQLQEAREKRGLSPQDVAHETRIPLRTITALEANDYSTFSSPAYTKSFLQQYSDFLLIDADDMLENFDTGNVLVQSDGIEYLDQEKISKPQRSAAPRRIHSHQVQPSSPSLAQPLLILLITGGLIAGGIWGFFAVEKRLNADPERVTDASPEKEGSKPAEANPALVDTPEVKPLPGDGKRPPRVITSGNSETVASTNTGDGTVAPTPPPFEFPEDEPPPRAIIVEEDDE